MLSLYSVFNIPQTCMESNDFDIIQPADSVFTVYCKDSDGVTLLNKAFKDKGKAERYALQKITTLLSIINDEYRNSAACTLPIGAQFIYIMFLKQSENEQYDYFKEHHKQFFRHVLREPIMFFVAQLELV